MPDPTRSARRAPRPRRPPSILAPALGPVVAALLLTGCTAAAEPEAGPDAPAAPAATSVASSPAPAAPSTTADPPTGSASAVLATLRVRGRAAMTGYDRDLFGQGWVDTDRNGCDTRNDLLAVHLTQVELKPGTNGCVVLSGALADPYTGTDVAFVRGDGALVDIDHVVALGNRWVSGAHSWPAATRVAFANDPVNLLPVDAGQNRQKGDGDAATWLPADRSYRCAYVARQVAVKSKYALSVTPAERDAIAGILSGCAGEPLPTDSGLPTSTDVGLPAPSPAPSSAPAPAPAPDAGTAYESCAAVRSAGAAPIRSGEPGYGRHLDRDGDGVGCE